MRSFYQTSIIYLLLMLLSFAAIAQDRTVQGTVTDEKNLPLPGATIVVTGTTTAVTTDVGGKFKITVPSNGKSLTITFVGMEDQQVAIAGQQNLTVNLRPAARNLNEVVVVGYGTQKRTDVTSSISRVDLNKANEQPVTGVEQAIQGRVAGVTVTSTSGLPGSAIQVRIRGIGTVNNNDPLYVVDGVPVSGMNYLNPTDIESVDILKDASAAAIYGTRAANGVVLITTKKGKAGNTVLTFDGYYGIASPWKDYKPADNNEYMYMVGAAYGKTSTEYATAQAEYNKGYNTNWFKAIIKNAPVENYNVGISGGGDKSHFLINAGYLDQNGMVTPSGYKRITFRSNSDYKLRDWLKIGENLSISNETTPNTEADILSVAYQYDPLVPVTDPTKDQSDPFNKYGESNITFGSNPNARLARYIGETQALRMVGNVFANVNLTKDVVFSSNYGLDVDRSNANSFNPTYYLSASDNNTTSSASQSAYSSNHWVWANTVTWTPVIGKNNFNILAGTSFEHTTNTGIYGTGYGQPSNDPDFQNINSSSSSTYALSGGPGIPYGLNSYFARADYNYDGKYLLQGSVRRDGTSNFASDRRWGTFPAASAGWVISKEDFWKSLNAGWFNMLKLRGGYGQLGNQNVPNAGAYDTFIGGGGSDRYVLGTNGNIVQGYSMTNLGNALLHWETDIQTNIGFEAAFFNNSLTASVDLYDRKTKDMIVALPVAATFGVNSPTVNVGSVDNKGIEFTANYEGHIGKLGYSVGGNISHYNNMVTSLGGGQPYVEEIPGLRISGFSRTAVGMPIGEFYGLKTNGIFQSQAQINSYVNSKGQLLQPYARPGDMIFVDTNHDGVIDNNDKTDIGSPHPKFTYGGNINLNYMAFDLALFIQGSYGNKIFDATQSLTGVPLGFYNVQAGTAYAAWTPQNHSNTQPLISNLDPNNNYQASDWYVKDGSYMRLKTLQIGYTLPGNILKRAQVSSLRIYIAGQNLLTFTKYPGLDPEIGPYALTGDARAQRIIGADYATFPNPRVLQVGASMKF